MQIMRPPAYPHRNQTRTNMLPFQRTDDSLMLVVRDNLEVGRQTCNPSLLPTPTAPPGHHRNGGMDGGFPNFLEARPAPFCPLSHASVKSPARKNGQIAPSCWSLSNHANFSRRVVGMTLETRTRRQFPCLRLPKKPNAVSGSTAPATVSDVVDDSFRGSHIHSFWLEQHLLFSALDCAALCSSPFMIFSLLRTGCKAATDGAWKVWLADAPGALGVCS
ncbi:hypothetical protein QBC34DRAFT_209590 [Podospora aff. communis PSN243]|uniref:Uncharacterized protein n=1 Tax=Podospora aff. communis PSN243 TaxID=3040156 RepID=A0AAV9GYI1_9PEZI|nr:hypothetical protein QBC34DRAFT_209590 [Podospora aff. communis PSN243]